MASATMPGVCTAMKCPVSSAWNRAFGMLRANRLDQRGRAQPVMRAGQQQHRAGDLRQFLRHRCVRQHAGDRGETFRVVRQPAGAEAAVLLGVWRTSGG